jgi:acyl-coenzyme A synthetase/AMP-(fatty) acid ligase
MSPDSRMLSIMPGFRPGGILVWRNGAPVSHERFVGQVLALAESLPHAPCAIALCDDRHLFMAILCACAVRGLPCLLPPDRLAHTIEDVIRAHPGALCIADSEIPGLDYPLWRATLPDAPDADIAMLPLVPAERECAVAFTSGSTGQPTPHPKRWGDLMLGAEIAARRFGIGPEATLVATVPAQHMYGLELSVLVPLAVGAATDSGRPFFPEDVRRTLGQVTAPRVLIATPVHLSVCAGSGLDWPSIDFAISATAPLSEELARQAEERLGTRVFEIYGCTEAGSMASRRTIEGPSWTWYDTVRAATADAGTAIEADFLPAPVPLADALEFESDGRFKLLGRHRDLLKVAGKRASLVDLNLKLASIPGVLDGVFVAPESDDGEVSRLAAIVAAPGLDRETLLRALRGLIDSAFLPRPLVLVDALPRNAAGKLPRHRLVELVHAAATCSPSLRASGTEGQR